jgi:predicted nucleotide-binding protein (sugar kinase/HSP70/actin superfamily)
VPGLVDFFLFGLTSPINMKGELGSKASKRLTHMAGIKLIEAARKPMDRMLAQSSRFEPYEDIFELADKAEQVLSLCNTMGEGWLLTAEMVDLIEHGTPNIVCAQPFACLPNHVVGKSVIKRLRQMHPESNIVAVDYDPGASEVNQLNRIKLMISVAKENYRKDHSRGFHLENPNDPTVNDAVAPYVDESRYHHDSIVNEGGVGHGAPAIHLSDEQLAQIEDAKRRAGVIK